MLNAQTIPPRSEKNMAKKPLKLTAHEVSFLRWLRGNGGSGARSGNKWIGSADRLVEADYVTDRTDPFRPATVHYVLTQAGAEALGRSENLRTEDP
jgi:hypothetical protein